MNRRKMCALLKETNGRDIFWQCRIYACHLDYSTFLLIQPYFVYGCLHFVYIVVAFTSTKYCHFCIKLIYLMHSMDSSIRFY
jgi:hypothetical protein